MGLSRNISYYEDIHEFMGTLDGSPKAKNSPTDVDLQIEAIRGTIKAYKDVGATPHAKQVIISCSMDEAIEVFLTIRDAIRIIYMINGQEWVFFTQAGNYYAVNNSRVQSEVESGRDYNEAYIDNKIRISKIFPAYKEIKDRVDKSNFLGRR